MSASSRAPLRLIPLLCLPVFGCFDFVGEAGRIGFSTSVKVGGQPAWSPELAVAHGSAFGVEPSERLDRPEGQAKGPLSLAGTVEGGLRLLALPPGAEPTAGALLIAPRCLRSSGVVRFTGETEDSFHLRFERAVSADLDDVYLHFAGLQGRAGLPTDRFALPPRAEVPLSLVLRDRGGAELGWDPAQITVESSVPWMSATVDAEGLILVKVEGALGATGVLTTRHAGRALGRETVTLVDPLAAPRFELFPFEVSHRGEVSRLVGALPITADGAAVLQAPVTWSGEGARPQEQAPAWQERSDLPLTAHLGERSLPVPP